ncbi:SDR family oxidoreductase [Dermacoccaceae bacterium W4C1]
MADILVIGGHGKVAMLTAPLLVASGHTVDAVIRNPDHAAEVAATGANPVVADVQAMDLAQWTALIQGHDVLVWSAGAGGGDPERTYAVDRDAAIRSMDAAASAGRPRYVMVSYFGAGPEHGVPESEGFFHYAQAKADADAHLRASDLDWIVLGPSALTDEPGTGRVSVGGNDKASVSRADVAAVIDAVIAGPAGFTYEFNNGDIPVAEAVQRAGADR